MSEPQYPDFTAHGYQVIEQLGRNPSAGRVSYKALSINTGQIVVIKQFQWVGGSSTLDGERQIEREIQTLRSLHHPKIPSYLDDFKTESASFCIVQEFIDAQTLSENNDFTPQEIKSVAIQLLEILVYLQSLLPPIIHRDIKPENILVDDNLNVYLIDFGFAKIGEGEATALSSIALGTPGFMSPEQVNNLPLTEATDLYGLGATLICLLCKIQSKDFVDIVDYNFQIDFKTRVSHLSVSFIKWLDKLVRLKPDERFSNAQGALNALLPLELIRIPELHLSRSSFAYEAKRLGEKIIQTIELNNPIPETVLEGSILSYQQKESRRHDWLTIFYPKSKRFKGNQTSCTFEIDTSKLTANKVYQREIIFESNARQNNTPFNISIKTAPLPRPILPPYLLLAGIYLIFTIGSKFVWIQDNLILQLSITILAALAVFGEIAISILYTAVIAMMADFSGFWFTLITLPIPYLIAWLIGWEDYYSVKAATIFYYQVNILNLPIILSLPLLTYSAGITIGIITGIIKVKNEKITLHFEQLLLNTLVKIVFFVPIINILVTKSRWIHLSIWKIPLTPPDGGLPIIPWGLWAGFFTGFLSSFYMFPISSFSLSPIFKIRLIQNKLSNKFINNCYLYLTIGLAIASGIGSQVGWHNVYILTTLLITGIPLLILLLFPPIYYGRIITKYSKNIY